MSKKVIEDDITMTSKGTFTLPIKIRRLLGLSDKGAKLKIIFDTDRNEAVITKHVSFTDIQEMTQVHLRKDKKPLSDVSSFYQQRSKDA